MWNSKVLFFIIMLICFLGFHEGTGQLLNAEEGPYDLVLYNTSNCGKERAWFKINVTTFTSNGESLLRGRAVITRELKDVKFRIQVFIIKETKVKIFDAKNQNCRNFIVEHVLNTIGVQFNKQKCSIKPGTVEFDNLNINKVFHSFVQQPMWYGNLQTRWEVAIPAAQVTCLEFNIKMDKI